MDYAKDCFQFQKYDECITSTNRIINQAKAKTIKLNPCLANEAKLYKGKSLFYSYQNMQQVYLRRRALDSIKEVEFFKHQCYERAREAILLLGTALDYNFIDEEGSNVLDVAMIDYLRETNNLNSCQRCLLCRKKTKLRRSHVVPKFILKDIAKDFTTEENDHKVFSSLIGKVTKPKSAGEVTVGMLCGECEQCLSQNGEEKFYEQIHSKICINREVVKSQLFLEYGSWLYDFCVGILFRSFAVCGHPFESYGSSKDLYNLFINCRKHLLSLPTNAPAQQTTRSEAANMKPTGSSLSCILPPNKPLRIFFFINPTVARLKFIPKVPASFMSPINLDQGIYSHDRKPTVFLAHFDSMNILVPFQTEFIPSIEDGLINPYGGKLVIPAEHMRWQIIPTGIWKLFSAFSQAKKNVSSRFVDHSGGTTDQTNFVYYPENIIRLNNSTVLSFLPSTHSHRIDGNSKVSLQLPVSHRVLVRVTKKWGHEQEINFFVIENSDTTYLVFILSVPGWQIIDGLLLDMFNYVLIPPFLDGRQEERHPLKVSVLQAWTEQVKEIKEFLIVRRQLC